MAASRRAAAAMLCLAVAVAAVLAAEKSGAEAERPGCFCDCMKNRCMTLGASVADKFDCAAACTEGCAQIGQPGQPRADDFCGF